MKTMIYITSNQVQELVRTLVERPEYIGELANESARENFLSDLSVIVARHRDQAQRTRGVPTLPELIDAIVETGENSLFTRHDALSDIVNAVCAACGGRERGLQHLDTRRPDRGFRVKITNEGIPGGVLGVLHSNAWRYAYSCSEDFPAGQQRMSPQALIARIRDNGAKTILDVCDVLEDGAGLSALADLGITDQDQDLVDQALQLARLQTGALTIELTEAGRKRVEAFHKDMLGTGWTVNAGDVINSIKRNVLAGREVQYFAHDQHMDEHSLPLSEEHYRIAARAPAATPGFHP